MTPEEAIGVFRAIAIRKIEWRAIKALQQLVEDTMPSKTPKQAKTMRAAAHNPEFAKKVGIPTSVAKEFVSADKKEGDHGKAKGSSKGRKY